MTIEVPAGNYLDVSMSKIETQKLLVAEIESEEFYISCTLYRLPFQRYRQQLSQKQNTILCLAVALSLLLFPSHLLQKTSSDREIIRCNLFFSSCTTQIPINRDNRCRQPQQHRCIQLLSDLTDVRRTMHSDEGSSNEPTNRLPHAGDVKNDSCRKLQVVSSSRNDTNNSIPSDVHFVTGRSSEGGSGSSSGGKRGFSQSNHSQYRRDSRAGQRERGSGTISSGQSSTSDSFDDEIDGKRRGSSPSSTSQSTDENRKNDKETSSSGDGASSSRNNQDSSTSKKKDRSKLRKGKWTVSFS